MSTPIDNGASALPIYHTCTEIAHSLKLSTESVRRIFQDHQPPEVVKITKGRIRGKRVYVSLRISDRAYRAYLNGTLRRAA